MDRAASLLRLPLFCLTKGAGTAPMKKKRGKRRGEACQVATIFFQKKDYTVSDTVGGQALDKGDVETWRRKGS